MKTELVNKEITSTNKSSLNFNEAEWIKLLFLLSDTQTWLDEMNKEMFRQLPVSKKRFISKNYYLAPSVLAHILERHYYKINRYHHAGKFHISLIEIIHLIREAYTLPVTPAPGSNNFERTLHADHIIGYDKSAQPTNTITILTDAGGRIITAFPGFTLWNGED